MKKFYYFSLMLGLLFGSLTFVACGDDDDDNPATNQDTTKEDDSSTNSITVDDLVGTWVIKGHDYTKTCLFEKDSLKFFPLYDNGKTETYAYTLQGDQLTYGDREKTTWKLSLIRDKAVLVIYVQREDKSFEFESFLYKNDKEINVASNELDGTWYWYMYEETKEIRVALTLSGNNFDMIITAWGQRYKGTFQYQNGYLVCNTTEGYTSREENTGEGWGHEDLDPFTLEATWRHLDMDSWMTFPFNMMPFVPNGQEAYGNFANVPGVFVKQ